MINPTPVETQVKALIERNIIVRKLDKNFNPKEEHLIETEEWAKLSVAVTQLEERYKKNLS